MSLIYIFEADLFLSRLVEWKKLIQLLSVSNMKKSFIPKQTFTLYRSEKPWGTHLKGYSSIEILQHQSRLLFPRVL